MFPIIGFLVSSMIKRNTKETVDNKYSTKDVAKILNMSEYSLRKKIRNNEIEAQKDPGQTKYKITKDAIAKYTQKELDKLGVPYDVEPIEVLQNHIIELESSLKILKLEYEKFLLDDNDSIDFKRKSIDYQIQIEKTNLKLHQEKNKLENWKNGWKEL